MTTETMKTSAIENPNEKEEQDQGLQGPSKEPVSASARERGAIVLEVLAGTLQPLEAAQSLGINAPAYYNLEARALQGLVRACEPRVKGPGVNLTKRIRELEETNQKLEREARRYQTLTRAAQKAIGLQMKVEERKGASGTEGPGKKKRRPKKARALRAAERLRGKTKARKTRQSLQKAGAE